MINTELLDVIAQIGITITGVLSVFLIAHKSKWGPMFGLLGEPFWFLTSIINKQAGIVVLTVVYTIGWGLGVYKWWWKHETD